MTSSLFAMEGTSYEGGRASTATVAAGVATLALLKSEGLHSSRREETALPFMGKFRSMGAVPRRVVWLAKLTDDPTSSCEQPDELARAILMALCAIGSCGQVTRLAETVDDRALG
jgi:hypothetical protein